MRRPSRGGIGSNQYKVRGVPRRTPALPAPLLEVANRSDAARAEARSASISVRRARVLMQEPAARQELFYNRHLPAELKDEFYYELRDRGEFLQTMAEPLAHSTHNPQILKELADSLLEMHTATGGLPFASSGPSIAAAIALNEHTPAQTVHELLDSDLFPEGGHTTVQLHLQIMRSGRPINATICDHIYERGLDHAVDSFIKKHGVADVATAQQLGAQRPALRSSLLSLEQFDDREKALLALSWDNQ